jgi:hypothetical protein
VLLLHREDVKHGAIRRRRWCRRARVAIADAVAATTANARLRHARLEPLQPCPGVLFLAHCVLEAVKVLLAPDLERRLRRSFLLLRCIRCDVCGALRRARCDGLSAQGICRRDRCRLARLLGGLRRAVRRFKIVHLSCERSKRFGRFLVLRLEARHDAPAVAVRRDIVVVILPSPSDLASRGRQRARTRARLHPIRRYDAGPK